MALKQRIADDTKAALLGGDRFVGEVLRGLKAAILDEEVAQKRREEGLADADIEKIVAREVKKRREAVKLYRENGREDLAEPEEREAEVLGRYLPAQMSEDEVRAVVQEKIAELSVDSPQAMGKVIGATKQQLGNMVDGAVLAAIVKDELTNN